MYPTYNEGKLVVTERFIKTLKGISIKTEIYKIYKTKVMADDCVLILII